MKPDPIEHELLQELLEQAQTQRDQLYAMRDLFSRFKEAPEAVVRVYQSHARPLRAVHDAHAAQLDALVDAIWRELKRA
ncbi:MAG TPA: hypothetical protein VD931_22930 [Baekduia sp.]|nr:hypothetical protein [Baekduia sp.]